jgi:signal transduction histidine kinase
MKAVQYGAYAYIEKPFDSAKMLDTVAAAYKRYTTECDRRALEDLAMEASRFETLGRLVSGTMHDLGTPLTVLNSHLELLAINPHRDDIERRIETMRSQVSYCTEITKNTMDYLRHEKGAHGPVSLNDIVHSTMAVARPYFRETNVECEAELEGSLPNIMGEDVLLRQSILNVVNNACQAMQSREADRMIYIRSFTESELVVLEIEDNGTGIPDSARGRIFEMFYSTKGASGTGLGLGVVSNVMERCGGSIKLVEGRHGSGACFRMQFPKCDERREASETLVAHESN